MYVHVPAAIWSMGVYGSMAVAAIIALVWQIKAAHLSMIAMAPIGAMFTFIALVTGAIWGKPMWGNLVGMGCAFNRRTHSFLLIYRCISALFCIF